MGVDFDKWGLIKKVGVDFENWGLIRKSGVDFAEMGVDNKVRGGNQTLVSLSVPKCHKKNKSTLQRAKIPKTSLAV